MDQMLDRFIYFLPVLEQMLTHLKGSLRLLMFKTSNPSYSADYN